MAHSGDFSNPQVGDGRIIAHFLTKFNNQDKDSLLSERPSAVGARCLLVSKKHSGHLVMAPPFYSKNGVGNSYSRLGELLLRQHFSAVWPDDPSAFEKWWDHATEHSLCYSFECVAPRVCGDHGATPRAAYMVLTCVVHTGGEGILSPAELLTLGAAWRLPLNQAWYVPWESSAAIERELHNARWTITDSEADVLLSRSGSAAGAVEQCFLRHVDCQGEVLEGFVLMALDTPLEMLQPLVRAYDSAVAPHRAEALRRALELGDACHTREASLMGSLETPGFREPTRHSLSRDKCWELACSGDGPLPRLFRVLRDSYAHRVVLKAYKHNGQTQLQIDIRDDQIFYGWPLHVASQRVAPLFRGMVVQYGEAPSPPLPLSAAISSCPSALGSVPIGRVPVHVLGIGKLKCLEYISRTFGVRNLLNVVLEHGPAPYLQRVERFFSNWSVPEEHRPVLREKFGGWARLVARLPAPDRQELSDRSYLKYLEPYLNGDPATCGDGDAGRLMELYSLMLVNLTGRELLPSEKDAFASGMTPSRTASQAGTYCVVPTPPTARHFCPEVPTVVVILAPREGADVKWSKMYDRCRDLHRTAWSGGGEGSPDHVFDNPSAAEWAGIIRDLPPPAAARAASSRKQRVLYVSAALPPGGGKSHLFALMQNQDCAVASSDAARAAGRSFDEDLRKMLDTHPAVCYDKNVPNADALAKLCKVVKAIKERHNLSVRVLLVIPSHLDPNVAWDRVLARSAEDIALTVHMQGGKAAARRIFETVFLDPSLAFLPDALKLPGVTPTDAFWGDEKDIAALADALKKKASAGGGATLDELKAGLEDLTQNPGGGGKVGAGTYVCAELEGTNLHVTLVPPAGAAHLQAAPGDGNDSVAVSLQAHAEAINNMRRHVGRTLRVLLGTYHVVRSVGDGPARQLAMWEVERVEDLPDHYAPQAAVYHVTDTASLVGCAPREAAVFLGKLRSGGLGPGWSAKSSNPASAGQPAAWLPAVVTEV